MFKGFVNVDVSDYFTLAQSRITSGNGYKIASTRFASQETKHFFNRVVNAWNSLPASVLESKSLATFKNRLEKYLMSNSEIRYFSLQRNPYSNLVLQFLFCSNIIFRFLTFLSKFLSFYQTACYFSFTFSCRPQPEGGERGEEPLPLLYFLSDSQRSVVCSCTGSFVGPSRTVAVCTSFMFLCIPLHASSAAHSPRTLRS